MNEPSKKWRCFVPGCKNTAANDDIGFFPLNKDPAEQIKFKELIERGTGYLIELTAFDMIVS